MLRLLSLRTDYRNIINHIHIQTGCSKKTLFFVFAIISFNTYSREMSWISTELAWHEASSQFQPDFLCYLVHKKIDILGVLTLIERMITPIQMHEF